MMKTMFIQWCKLMFDFDAVMGVVAIAVLVALIIILF